MSKYPFDSQRTHDLCIADSRIKVPVFFLLLIVPIFLREIMALGLLFALLLVIFFASKIRISTFFRILKRIWFFVVFVVVLNVFLGSGEGIGEFSLEGLQSGFVAALKVMCLYFAASIFVVTTSQGQVAQGVASILRPLSSAALGRKVALYGFIVMGFVPVFVEEAKRIQVAQRFRRGGMAGNLLAKVQSAPTIIVPLIISALHRSSQLAAVVELREVESKLPWLAPLEKPSLEDCIWLGIVLVVIALSLLIQNM